MIFSQKSLIQPWIDLSLRPGNISPEEEKIKKVMVRRNNHQKYSRFGNLFSQAGNSPTLPTTCKEKIFGFVASGLNTVFSKLPKADFVVYLSFRK
jgi:hypothetical protein